MSYPLFSTSSGLTAIQPEYNKYFVVSYNQNAGGVDRTVMIAASAAYLGATAATFDVTMPDLSPLPGWVGSWGFLTRNPITWWFNATGWDATGGITVSPFAEGASSRTATRRGELRT